MALAKLTITPCSPCKKVPEFGPGGIEVMFNPNAYSITKAVTWGPPESSGGGKNKKNQRGLNAPALQFGGGGSRQLTLELFFDVTEDNAKVDVREETNKIVALTRIPRDQSQPPVCLVAWGEAPPDSDFPFVGVVSSLTQRFTLFTNEGRPVRANLSVTFLEFISPEKDQRKTDPEVTTRVIKRGDTLSSIAAEAYRDPARWRIIAENNRLDDPRHLQVGQRLTIPKL